ncbi:FtsX-like permease family protein [Urbifossiella limnaea]|uniref:Macrolide export ATP-binding/permease protein MacB n=1 Tax=Urbifossiella limnaea TaxID=2528023 RepID=A0A517XM64_9BACT|nr:ABC transporter permease [Urbifossiella limnaea]QDU18604.1 Macrolide export ATP-binding/permease protein MacB [Urbifossiella limnaea]
MTVYRLLALRYALHRWDRAALVVASIALGVAALVSARALNQCVETAARETKSPLAVADLSVSNGEALVPHKLAEAIRRAAVPGVRAVSPIVYDRITLPQLDDRVAVLVGVEISAQLLQPDNALKVTVKPTGEGPLLHLFPVWQAVQDGNFSAVPALWDRVPGKLVMVTKPVYDAWRATAGPGKPLVLKYAGRETECLPIGVLEFAADSPLASLGANFVGMEVGQAAGVLRPQPPFAAVLGAAGVPAAADWERLVPTRVNRLDLFLEPGADRDQVAADVGRVVGNPGAVRTPDAQQRATQEIISGLQIGFLVCSAGAMIVGLFLVYNAMAVTVAERRTDIGILRAVGATRLQVVLLFSAAGAILGVAGAALGIPLGALMADFALTRVAGEMSAMFLNPDVDATRVTPATVALAMLAGVGTAVFAALVPAVQAAADDPADAARRTVSGAKGGWRVLHRATCAALVGGGLTAVVFRHELPARVGSVGGMLVALVGLLLAAPIVVGILAALVRPIVRATCGVSVRLAFDNLTRAPGRTGVVVGALGAGVALMVQTAGVGRSNEEPVVEWITSVVQAEHFVFSGNMTSASSSNSPMALGVARDLKALPGVDRVMTIRYARPEYNGTVVYLIAVDCAEYARGTRDRVPEGLPELEKVLALPGTDDALVSDNFALRHGVKVGDVIELPGPRGPVHIRVVGTIRDYSWSRGSLIMDRASYARLFGDDLIDICHVFLKPGASARPVEQYAARYGLFATDREALRQFLSELINRVYLLAYIQQVVVGLVAALGVVTALLISVLQRKRELGLLLAVGATPAQVLRTVLAEAVLMGVFGTALGLLIGLPMEWYVVRVVLTEETGFVLDVVVPWREAFLIAGGALLTATLAGLLPAWHAVRTRIPDAIQWE